MGFERNELIDLMMVFPRKTANISRLIVSKYLKDSRIKPHHLMMLKALSEGDGMSQKDLCEILPFDKSYISTGVRELIDMDLAVNRGEGKIHRLYPTDLGRDIASMGDMMFDLVESSMFGFLSDEERESLICIMRKIDAHTDELISQYSEKIS